MKPLSAGRVVLHTGAIFVMSFLVSGAGNVLAQLFYQRHHPDKKVLLLGVCLFVGAAGSTAGVLLARRGGISRMGALIVLGGVLSAAAGLVLVRGAYTYIAVNMAMQLGANFLVNHLDHAAVAHAGDERRKLNDAASNLARLFGMLGGPPLFTAAYDHPQALFAMLGAIGALAVVSAAALLGAAAGPLAGGGAAGGASASLPASRADRFFFAYAVSVYGALYLLAANLIYLLRDVLHVPSAESRAATMVMLVFLSAVIGNAAGSALFAKRSSPSAIILAFPALILIGETALLRSGIELSYGALVAGGMTLGGAYGLFLVDVRGYASRGAREGKTVLLTFFNNMANLSALTAFATMSALVAIAKATGGAVYGWVVALIGALPALGLPLLAAAMGARKR